MYKIATILNGYKVVINAGTENGVCMGQRYLIYALSDDEILDPDTGKSLGYLEIVKGTGIVTHVQNKMATLESDTYKNFSKKYRKPTNAILKPYFPSPSEEIETERRQMPFDNPDIGDLVKQVN